VSNPGALCVQVARDKNQGAAQRDFPSPSCRILTYIIRRRHRYLPFLPPIVLRLEDYTHYRQAVHGAWPDANRSRWPVRSQSLKSKLHLRSRLTMRRMCACAVSTHDYLGSEAAYRIHSSLAFSTLLHPHRAMYCSFRHSILEHDTTQSTPASTGGILARNISRKAKPVQQTVEVLLTDAIGVGHANVTAGRFLREV
jgi:hypothetical protein